MDIFARESLAQGVARGDQPALLLEGSWSSSGSSRGWSLDVDLPQGSNWIDAEAARLAEAVARRAAWRYRAAADDPSWSVSWAWLDALALRYTLVRALRVEAFLLDLWRREEFLACTIHAEPGRDEFYVDVIQAIAATRGIDARVAWRSEAHPAAPAGDPGRSRRPQDALWRRLARTAAKFAIRGQEFAAGAFPLSDGRDDSPFLFLGDARVLGPIADELRRREEPVVWARPELSPRATLRDLWSGVRHFSIDLQREEQAAPAGAFQRGPALGPLTCRGVDLAPAVQRWIESRVKQQGVPLARALSCLDQRFAEATPRALVLDEDATPLARAAIACARRHGVRSSVVQHGAPYVRFGFAPLEADQILAWGESSRAQLEDWGVPSDRIVITGAPAMKRRDGRPVGAVDARRRALLLATNPPRDERPEPIGLSLTTASHEATLRTLVQTLAEMGHVRLDIRPHPRATDLSLFARLAEEFPGLELRVDRRGSVASAAAGSSFVINFGSSAAIEAALAGVPVIEVSCSEEPGPVEPIQAGRFVSTREDAARLRELIEAMTLERCEGELGRVVDCVDREAAARAVDVILESNRLERDAPLSRTLFTRVGSAALAPTGAAAPRETRPRDFAPLDKAAA